MRIAVVFVGALRDGGFNECALTGAERARDEFGVPVDIVDGIPYDEARLLDRLADVAATAEGIVVIGGQGNRATPQVAEAFADRRFAVVQGNVSGPNLVSYDILQEQSAFLAGCLAALVTRSGIVGHLSGHRVRPGLKGRAAFVAGVAHIDPAVRVLTGFCGTQDDSAVTQRWAAAEIAGGADIVFTMLNAARTGAIEACRAGGARQIGNVLDWTVRQPDIFIASALARIDHAVRQAISDMVDGNAPDGIVSYGLADSEFVSLALHSDVPDPARARIAAIADGIRNRTVDVATDYDGVEFEPAEVA